MGLLANCLRLLNKLVGALKYLDFTTMMDVGFRSLMPQRESFVEWLRRRGVNMSRKRSANAKTLRTSRALILPSSNRLRGDWIGRQEASYNRPIRDGSFLDAKAQSKFDMAKEHKCSRCGVDDTHEHRCFHCVKFASVHARDREPLIPP